MKNVRVYTCVFCSLMFCAAMVMSTASAQIIEIVKFTVGSDVTIAGNTLPAGTYSVQQASGMTPSPVLRFRSESGKSIEVLANVIPTSGNAASPKTEVVLNGHALVKLWIEGEDLGYSFAQ